LKQKNEAKRKATEAAEVEKNKKNEEEMLNEFLSSLPAEEKKVSSEEPTEERTIEPQPKEEEKREDVPSAEPEVQEEALLEGFFSELNEAAKEKEKKKEAEDNAKHTELLNEKYTKQDLGTPLEQYHRLTCPHYEFKNQNPYYVLQLDIDATMEDIKYRSPLILPLSLLSNSNSLPWFLSFSCCRYRKLSAKVHPDKLRDVENSRLAFEEVRGSPSPSSVTDHSSFSLPSTLFGCVVKGRLSETL
jgi:DnaJ homolog subfamily C member 8